MEIIEEEKIFTPPPQLEEEEPVCDHFDMCLYLELCESNNVPYLADCLDSTLKCTQLHKIKHIKESALEVPMHKNNR